MIGVLIPAAAQLAADLEAVLAGQHDVEQDQVEGPFRARCRARFAVRRDLDVVAFDLQIDLAARARLPASSSTIRMRFMPFLRRQQDRERAALAGLALQPDLAVVRFDDVPHHRQADAGPLDVGAPWSRCRGRTS